MDNQKYKCLLKSFIEEVKRAKSKTVSYYTNKYGRTVHILTGRSKIS